MQNTNDDKASLYPLFFIFCIFDLIAYIFQSNMKQCLSFPYLFIRRLLIPYIRSTCYQKYLKRYVFSIGFLWRTGHRRDSLNFLKFPSDVILINFFPGSQTVAWKMINTDNLQRTLFLGRLKLFLIRHDYSLIKILITSQ